MDCRFIPACVGNSDLTLDSGNGLRPRFIPACVGNSSCIVARVTGSSPRVWGTRYRSMIYGVANRARFIPACVGNSYRSCLKPLCASVHPRVCGELVIYGERSDLSNRFIPACVGNSQVRYPAKGLSPVHPRVCGELHHSSVSLAQFCGSSPRVWGTLLRVQNGIDPHASVHPRVCGELDIDKYAFSLTTGSSPRVWGTPGTAAPPPARGRFIPACVGNSYKIVPL